MDKLIERLEAGETGRDLDQAIYDSLNLCPPEVDGTYAIYHAPMYTTSLDAAQALHETVLPGWYWTAYSAEDPFGFSVDLQMGPPSGVSCFVYSGTAPTPAAAWCAAILEAKSTEGE